MFILYVKSMICGSMVDYCWFRYLYDYCWCVWIFIWLLLISLHVVDFGKIRKDFILYRICLWKSFIETALGYVDIEVDIGGWYTSWVLLSSTAPILIDWYWWYWCTSSWIRPEAGRYVPPQDSSWGLGVNVPSQGFVPGIGSYVPL